MTARERKLPTMTIVIDGDLVGVDIKRDGKLCMWHELTEEEQSQWIHALATTFKMFYDNEEEK